MYTADLKVVMSIVFMFIGSTVFYIASLISGHNIYRDLPWNLSIFVTSTVGTFLFILSPISFLVLFPELFNLVYVPHTVWGFVIHLQRIIFKSVFVPYFAVSTGFGIIFGCLTAISFRRMLLDDIRKKTGLRYTIFSYGYTWDSLLQRVKAGGEITVKVPGSTITGSLKTYSVKEEPKQIILSCYKITPERKVSDASDHPEKALTNEKVLDFDGGDILLTESAEIQQIAVPEKSFNIHQDAISHTTQSIYMALTAIGFVLIAFSFDKTGHFLTKYSFAELAQGFVVLGFISLCVAILFFFKSRLLLAVDFNCDKSAVFLSPINFHVLTFTVYVISVGLLNLLDGYLTVATSATTILLTVTLLLLWAEHWFQSKAITVLFTDIEKEVPKVELKEAVEQACKETNLSAGVSFSFQEFCNDLNLSGKHHKTFATLESKISQFVKHNKCYSGDEWNLLLRLKWFLRRNEK